MIDAIYIGLWQKIFWTITIAKSRELFLFFRCPIEVQTYMHISLVTVVEFHSEAGELQQFFASQ